MADEFDENIDETQSILLEYLQSRETIKAHLVIVVSVSLLGILFLFGMNHLAFTIAEEQIVQDDQFNKIFSLFAITFMIIFGIMFVFLLTFGSDLIRFLKNGKKQNRLLQKAQSRLIHKSYLLNFELVSAEGLTQIDRLFNHLSLVFPEIKLRKDKFVKLKLNSLEEHRDKLIRKIVFFPKGFDLDIYTVTGSYYVKIFDKKVTFEDVKDIVKFAQNPTNKIKRGFFSINLNRLIILSKSYDDFFETPEFIEEINLLKRSFHLDLILEENDNGYSTIWID